MFNSLHIKDIDPRHARQPMTFTLNWCNSWAKWGPGPRLNIKTDFPRYGISMLNIRRSRDRRILYMGIPILARRHLNIERVPCSVRIFTSCCTLILQHSLHQQCNVQNFKSIARPSSCEYSCAFRIIDLSSGFLSLKYRLDTTLFFAILRSMYLLRMAQWTRLSAWTNISQSHQRTR